MAEDKVPEEQLNNLTVNDDDDVVDPWNVSGKSETGIDYDKLISKSVFIFNYYSPIHLPHPMNIMKFFV